MGQTTPTNASKARTGRDKAEKKKKKETTTAEFRQRRSPSKEIRADLKKNPLKHVLALFVREKQRRQDEGGAIGSSVPSWKYKNIHADTAKKRTRKYKPQTTEQKNKHKDLEMAPMLRRSGKPKDNNKPVWI